MFRFKLILSVAALLISVAIARPANIPVTVGLNAITIPTVPSLNYSAANIFSTPYEGEVIYRWNAPTGSWLIFTYFDGIGWDPATTFNVGEGIFYQALVSQTFVANFHGRLVPEIASRAEGPPPLLENRYYFQGSPTGQSATYEDVFGAPPNNETALFRFIAGRSDINPTGPDYRVYHYNAGVWTPETPILNPLEPVFVVYPYLSVKFTLSGNPKTINFTWPRGTLEEASLPGGPWQTVSAGNSHSVVATNQMRYYRAKE